MGEESKPEPHVLAIESLQQYIRLMEEERTAAKTTFVHHKTRMEAAHSDYDRLSAKLAELHKSIALLRMAPLERGHGT